MKVRLSAIQLCSAPNVEQNLQTIEQQLANLPKTSIPHLVVLPECCLFFGAKDSEQLMMAKQDSQQPFMRQALAQLARKYHIILVAGSIPVYQQDTNKYTNTSFIFNANGEQVAGYDKIHLFDVAVDDSEKNYLESRFTQAGQQLSVMKEQELTIGQTICYDLRFPELYRALTDLGAQIISVPSAFTQVTGQAHWEVLLRARAIENQVYIVAAGQQGQHENGRETWGHSMVIDPWGKVLAQCPQGVGYISIAVDLQEQQKIRRAIPVLTHNQFITKLTTYESS